MNDESRKSIDYEGYRIAFENAYGVDQMKRLTLEEGPKRYTVQDGKTLKVEFADGKSVELDIQSVLTALVSVELELG
jgi:hypothetical protein